MFQTTNQQNIGCSQRYLLVHGKQHLDSQAAKGHHLHILFLACHGCTAFPQKNVEPEMPLLRTSQQQETSRTQEFWETGTVVYSENCVQIESQFPALRVPFCIFLLPISISETFWWVSWLRKKGEGEAHMKVCHSFLGIWSWVGTLASLPIMIGAYQPVILTTNGCEMMWQGVSPTWVSHQTWVCRNGHNQNLWFPELQDYDPCPSQNYAPRGLCKLTHQITYELNFLLVTT